jgi:nitroreductase
MTFLEQECVATHNGSRLEPVSRDAGGTRLHPLLARRRSPLAFGGGPVPAETQARLFEAARWAPSSMNAQPWAFVVVHRGDPAHADAVDLLMGRNRLWASRAPLLVAAVARTVDAEGRPNRYAHYDLGQAVAHLTVQATAEGLAVHQMGGFDRERASVLFAVPDGWETVSMIAIGSAGRPEELPAELRVSEAAPRTRRPLLEVAFANRFGRPLE